MRRWANHPTNFCQGVRNWFQLSCVSLKLSALSASNISESCFVVFAMMVERLVILMLLNLLYLILKSFPPGLQSVNMQDRKEHYDLKDDQLRILIY